jgi:hypothetical protein
MERSHAHAAIQADMLAHDRPGCPMMAEASPPRQPLSQSADFMSHVLLSSRSQSQVD